MTGLGFSSLSHPEEMITTNRFSLSLLYKGVLPFLYLAGIVNGGSLEYAPAPLDNPLRGLVPYVSASGKEQFPHSMEFRYFALKDVLKGPGVYDWESIENTLRKVNNRKNQLIFRVYCEYPGRGLAIPSFLVDSGVEVAQWINKDNGQVNHTPDYANPLMRESLVAFVTAMGAKYDGDPRIAFITAGLLGSWGEWHTYPRDDLWASKEVQREIMESYENAFSKTKILLRYPAGPQTHGLVENHERPFGYHDDSFAWATLDTRNAKDSWFFEPSLRTAGATDKWKVYPIGGEIRPELWNQSFSTNRHPRDQGFMACVERLHVSWLLDSGLFDMGIPMDKDRKDAALNETARMGYELHISSVEWEDGILSLAVQNLGVAPFYYDWPLEIEVGGTCRTVEWKLSEILPGDTLKKWTIELAAKTEIKLRIPNPMQGGKPLRFANREQGKVWLTIKP